MCLEYGKKVTHMYLSLKTVKFYSLNGIATTIFTKEANISDKNRLNIDF